MRLAAWLAALFAPTTNHAANAGRIAASIVLSAAVLVLAHRVLKTRGRRALIVAVTFLGGLFFALEYFWPTHDANGHQVNFLTPFIEPATIALSVIGAFTVGLGVQSLAQVHANVLLRRRPGWYNSLAFFISMFAMFFLALWDFYRKAKPSATGVLPFPNATYEVLFNGVFQPLIAATFSLLAFYIASAAYRAFRIRSGEAAVMMASAFIVMLAQVPLGAWLTHGIPETSAFAFFRLERFGDWILKWWNSPAQRGITFGVAVGMLAMSLRLWLSLERGTFFSDQPEARLEEGRTEREAAS
jgi:hypothetical protein